MNKIYYFSISNTTTLYANVFWKRDRLKRQFPAPTPLNLFENLFMLILCVGVKLKKIEMNGDEKYKEKNYPELNDIQERLVVAGHGRQHLGLLPLDVDQILLE